MSGFWLVLWRAAGGVALMRTLRAWQRRWAGHVIDLAYHSTFSLADARPRLDEYVRLLTDAFGTAAFSEPPLSGVPFQALDRQAFLWKAIRLAAARFGMTPPPIAARFVADLPEDTAACLRLNADWTLHARPGRITVEARGEGHTPWQMLVHERFRDDDEALVAIVAHEIAHLALFAYGVHLEPKQRNEELTDVAAVLAGFGLLMLRARRRMDTCDESKGTRSVRLLRIGYIHDGALDYLLEVHARLRAGRSATAEITSPYA